MENLAVGDPLKIMKLVTEIAAAAVGNEGTPSPLLDVRGIEGLNKLVETLFLTMCELIDKAN